MSCEYYFRLKPGFISVNCPEWARKSIEEKIKEVTNIKIGQSAIGWRFILENNPKIYKDFGGLLEFYYSNKDKLMVVDEYEKEVKFESELLFMMTKLQGETRGYVDNDGYYWNDEPDDYCYECGEKYYSIGGGVNKCDCGFELPKGSMI